jgi:tetratricopeptide (TPR) repeat protein
MDHLPGKHPTGFRPTLALLLGMISGPGSAHAEAPQGTSVVVGPEIAVEDASTAGNATGQVTSGTGIEALPLEDRIALSARWDLGFYLFQQGDYAAAAGEFEKIRKVLPGEATLLALIGSCYSLTGRWNEGEKTLLEARQQAPADADVNGLLGQFYHSRGKSLKGAYYFENALKAAPELADLRSNLADLYLENGRPVRARSHLEALLRERGGEEFGEPKLEHAYARTLVQSGRITEALPFALRAYQAHPGNPAYSRTLGICLMAANRYGEAARLLDAGRNSQVHGPGDAELFLHWGEALYRDRRWDAAEDAWLTGVTRFPDAYPIYGRLIDFYVGTARPRMATRAADFAADQNPGHPGNLLLEARLSRKLGDFAASRKALIRLKRQAFGPMLHEALWEEAQLEYAVGRYSTCGKILDRLLARGHKQGEANVLKAKMTARRNEPPQAQGAVVDARRPLP